MTYELSLCTTLRELINVVPDMTDFELPTTRSLREKVMLLIRVDFSDGALEVYENGFFIYTAKRRSAVVRVHECVGDYYYEHADGSMDKISEAVWMKMPFIARMVIEGERQLEKNYARRARRHIRSYDIFEGDPMALLCVDSDIEGLEDAKVIRDAIDSLTLNQREIIDLVYVQGFSQAEVARMKGCSKSSVAESLVRARTRLRELLQKNEWSE